MAKYTAQMESVTRRAVWNSCARCDSSLKEYIATSPATSCTMMNSYWYFTAAAHNITITTWARNAVRESINTLINIGAMANGRIYTLKRLCSIINDTRIGKMVIMV